MHTFPSYLLRITYLCLHLPRGSALWQRSYSLVKSMCLKRLLSDPKMTALFDSRSNLPSGYGFGLDERCIEYIWFLAKMSSKSKEYLDAGSTLNNRLLLRHPRLKGKRLTILTLSPESTCFWRLGVSYHYSDIRKLPFRDAWFDEIACVSTLEHVGMDNRLYSKDCAHHQRNTSDFGRALFELRRVLKPGGRLLLTVPFGKYQNWGVFQQFDAALLDRAARVFAPSARLDEFYLYQEDGWQIAQIEDCQDCSYSEFIIQLWSLNTKGLKPERDYAAGARAVACSVWQRD
jgi:SAM-dependent methyltransferase